MSKTIPVIGMIILGIVLVVSAFLEFLSGRLEWAALMLVGAALCLSGARLRIAADAAAEWRGTPGPRSVRPLERGMQLLWTFASGFAMALAVAQWGAGRQEAATVYLMASGACALGLAVQLAAPYVFDRHSR